MLFLLEVLVLLLIGWFTVRMKVAYEKTATQYVKSYENRFRQLRLSDEELLNQVRQSEQQFADLSGLYEITRSLSGSIDLESLAYSLSHILDKTFHIKTCWLARLTLTASFEKKYQALYRIQKMNEQETQMTQPNLQWIEENLSGKLQIPFLVQNQPGGLLVIEGTQVEDHQYLENLSIIAGQLGLSLGKVELYQRIQELAIHDGLTEVYVRRHFLERFQEEFKRSLTHHLPLAFLMCDLDHFKEKNDTYGHLAGDELLKTVAQILKSNVREIDLVGRYGGEEFSIALPETARVGAWQVGERIRLAVQDSVFQIYDERIQTTLSMGIAILNDTIGSIQELIEKADAALYLAKNKGRNRVEVYEDL